MGPFDSLAKMTQKQRHNRADDRIRDYTRNGKCIRCGRCCSNKLPVTEEELTVLRRYIKKSKVKEIKTRSSIPIDPIAKSDASILSCPFFDPSIRRCTIYNIKPDIRPVICRKFVCGHDSRVMSETLRREMGEKLLDLQTRHMREELFNN